MAPLGASWRPRWAIGRAVSHSSAGIWAYVGLSMLFENQCRFSGSRVGNLEETLDFNGGIRRQCGDAHSTARMTALFTEYLHHQVGCAVHNLWAISKSGRRIDETAQPHTTRPLVEIAKRGLELRQQVHGAGARRFLPVLERHAAAELTFCGQLAVAAKAKLAGDDERVAAAHERHVIGNRACRGRQGDIQACELLFDESCHGVLPGAVICRDPWPIARYRARRRSARLLESVTASILPRSCIFLLLRVAPTLRRKGPNR